ncbi:hypothetical protein UY3_06826 [Chelonia mydas]|uniref:Uncharacterized protein n=1 Tax=Chelonia mydas TaxID=8469 RepID=M7BFM8_CHEMY|nr:hypothetical protein UY3_06826 [Chelonia mydas]
MGCSVTSKGVIHLTNVSNTVTVSSKSAPSFFTARSLVIRSSLMALNSENSCLLW